jgi:hypothetical protein
LNKVVGTTYSTNLVIKYNPWIYTVTISTGTSITENSVTQKHVLFTSRQTEYSPKQVPLDVVRRQMAPASVTIQLYRNRMLFASRRNRIFLGAGAFHCKKALAPVKIQLDQHRMLLTTSSRKSIFLDAGALGLYLLSSNGTGVGDNLVTSKLYAIC